MRAGEAAFSSQPDEEDYARQRKLMPLDRFLVAYDDGRPVGTTASHAFELTIPGGQLPAGGVTWVAVQPSHRRRGILSMFMRRQLEDLRERGEPLAILWSSESSIYGRFGYGVSALNLSMDADRSRFGLRDDAGSVGSMRMVGKEEAAEVLPPVYDRVRRLVHGMFSRTEEWWTEDTLADPESSRRGAGPQFYAVHESGNEIDGYAIYRMRHDWPQGVPSGELQVVEAYGVSRDATREVWRFLFGVDLAARVTARRVDPGIRLELMVTDPRSLHLRISDGLWLRLVDLEQALAAREYASDGAVVLDVRDDFCPWNEGRFRVGSVVERTDDAADLELDVSDLARVYLGAYDFEALEAAGRVREHRADAVAEASALFRTTRPPFAAEVF